MQTNENQINNNKEVKEKVLEIESPNLETFEAHPFKVVDENMEELIISIKELGLTTPLIVRRLFRNKYEIVSGHRRKRACEILGITTVPCIVRNVTKDEATIMMVDSNIQREELLMSEKAFAYKMKYDSIKRQGKRNDLTSSQLGTKLRADELIAKDIGESRNQIQRYIRLTKLVGGLLDLVDKKRIALNPAVEISYLYENEQEDLLKIIEEFEHTPSLSQAQQMRRLSKMNKLTEDIIEDILSEEKPNQLHKIHISYDRIRRYVPKKLDTPKEIETYLIKCAIVCRMRGMEVENLDIEKLDIEMNEEKY